MIFPQLDDVPQLMNSQVFYIVVAMMFASATLSIIFFIAWKTMGEKPHALSWAVGFLGATCQWFFNLNSNMFPSHATYWLTVNAFALVLITLGIRGHCQRTGCRRLPQNLWPFAGIIYAAVVWTTVVDPHTGFTMALVPAAASVTLFLSALMIIRHREVSRPAEWAAATAMVLFGLTQGIAAGMAMLQGPVGDDAYLSLYVHYNFLTLPAGYMAMGMFVVFMLASDLSEQMREIAVKDELTGLLNRRGFSEQGAAAFAAAQRSDQPVSVIMTDIDRFKFINDEYGHATGDTALEHFANILNTGRRSNDILARVGGEEFALVVPGTELRAATLIADELRAKIDSQPMLLNGDDLPMTASFGVATMSANDTCMTDIIVRADRALYRSKRAGRNQVDLESSQLMRASDGSLKPVSI
jgi:diguanylate cyclase (GGDEF)-like protein